MHEGTLFTMAKKDDNETEVTNKMIDQFGTELTNNVGDNQGLGVRTSFDNTVGTGQLTGPATKVQHGPSEQPSSNRFSRGEVGPFDPDRLLDSCSDAWALSSTFRRVSARPATLSANEPTAGATRRTKAAQPYHWVTRPRPGTRAEGHLVFPPAIQLAGISSAFALRHALRLVLRRDVPVVQPIQAAALANSLLETTLVLTIGIIPKRGVSVRRG